MALTTKPGTRITLDGTDLGSEVSFGTWRALLAHVDAEVAGRGLIVTDVRFDGLDEPAFRDPQVLERPLASHALVEVISDTPGSLMERCLAEAADSLGVLAENSLRVGEEFRRCRLPSAGAGLASLADGLSSLMGIVGAAAVALKVDLDAVSCEGRSASVLVAELTGLIDDLLEAHGRRDWIGVADILQYDIEPTLRRWRPLFGVVAQGVE